MRTVCKSICRRAQEARTLIKQKCLSPLHISELVHVVHNPIKTGRKDVYSPKSTSILASNPGVASLAHNRTSRRLTGKLFSGLLFSEHCDGLWVDHSGIDSPRWGRGGLSRECAGGRFQSVAGTGF